jgi:hypothetical protein
VKKKCFFEAKEAPRSKNQRGLFCEKKATQARVRFFFVSCVVVGQLVLGLASGLEAFSREPPCDSIGALAFRQTPETSGMAWEFLSYYPKLPSRCLRDQLTISLDEKSFSSDFLTESRNQVTEF